MPTIQSGLFHLISSINAIGNDSLFAGEDKEKSRLREAGRKHLRPSYSIAARKPARTTCDHLHESWTGPLRQSHLCWLNWSSSFASGLGDVPLRRAPSDDLRNLGDGDSRIQHPRHSSVPKIVKAAGQGSNLRCRIRLDLEDLRRLRGLFDRTFPNRATWQSGAVPPQFSPGPRLRFLMSIWRQSGPTVPVWPVMPSHKPFVINY